MRHHPGSVGPGNFRVVKDSQGSCGIRACVRYLCSVRLSQKPETHHVASSPSPRALPVDSGLPAIFRARTLEELSVASIGGSFSGRQPLPVLGAE